jgi:hypothetical protein
MSCDQVAKEKIHAYANDSVAKESALLTALLCACWGASGRTALHGDIDVKPYGSSNMLSTEESRSQATEFHHSFPCH